MYRQYQSVPFDWLHVIPSDWMLQRLKRLLVCHYGGCWGEEEMGDENDLLCIRIADFNYQSQSIKPSANTIRHYSDQQISSGCLQNGDLILEKSGGGEKTPVGRVVIFKATNDSKFMFANFSECLRPNIKLINSEYLAYYLKFFYYAANIGRYYKQTTGIQNVDIPAYLNIGVPVPPRDEQDQIVRFLDWKVSRINKLAAAKEKEIKLLTECMDRIYQDMSMKSTKRIRLKRLTRFAPEFITPVSEKMYSKAGMYNRGRGIFKREAMLGKDLGTSLFQWIRQGCVMISGQFAWEGAVYITTERDESAIISHRYYLLEIISKFISVEYLWAYFMSDEGLLKLNACSHGAAGRNKPLNINELLNIEIPIPEDDSNLQKLNLIVRTIMGVRLIFKEYSSKLKELKIRLISDAVTGQIDIRDIEIPEYERIEEDLDEDAVAETETEEIEERED